MRIFIVLAVLVLVAIVAIVWVPVRFIRRRVRARRMRKEINA
jgi:hypothetical protein